MRVLIVNSLFPPNLVGGAERSVAELAQDLDGLGARVTVLSLGREAREEDQGGIRALYTPLRNVGWPFGPERPPPGARKLWHAFDLWNPLMGAAVAAVLERVAPDVVHTNNLQGFSIAAWHAAARAGVPVAHTLRDHYLACARSSRCRDRGPCPRTCAACVPFLVTRRRASAPVAAAVGVSAHILELHRQLGFFPRARAWRVIHRGPAPRAGPRPAPAGRPLRLGTLGRLDPVKGVELAIRALPPGAELTVAGDGDPAYVATLRALAAGAAVRFPGVVDGRRFLDEIDVLVVPSLWHEPLARVLLEGLAAGVPIVASRRGGSPELVTDGENGFLFDPDEPGALAARLAKLATDPELVAELSRGALRRAEALARAPLGAAYLELYEELSRGAPARGGRPRPPA